MPSFSFTAPNITPEEERKERKELDDLESLSVQKDSFGEMRECHNDADGSSRAKVFSEHIFNEALDTIPMKDKKELLDAIELIPDLVATESTPQSFMSCDQHLHEVDGFRFLDYQAAARRVAQYWKHRRKLFGTSRAFLPMTLDEAMAEDVDTLQKGFFSVLPCDGAGRAVIFFDRIRAIPMVASKDAVCRALFYILQKVTEDEATQRKGFVFIENMVGYDLYTHFDRILTKTQMSLLRDCFPSLMRSYHMCAGQSGKWAVELVMPVLKQIAGKYIRLRTVCHAGSTCEILSTLETTYKLDRRHQSVIIGGNINYDHQLMWINEQMVGERSKLLGSTKKKPTLLYPPPTTISKLKKLTTLPPPTNDIRAPVSILSTESPCSRRVRRVNSAPVYGADPAIVVGGNVKRASCGAA